MDKDEILEICEEVDKSKQEEKKKQIIIGIGTISCFLVTLVAVIVELALTREMNLISLSGLFVGLSISACTKTIVSWSN